MRRIAGIVGVLLTALLWVSSLRPVSVHGQGANSLGANVDNFAGISSRHYEPAALRACARRRLRSGMAPAAAGLVESVAIV